MTILNITVNSVMDRVYITVFRNNLGISALEQCLNPNISSHIKRTDTIGLHSIQFSIKALLGMPIDTVIRVSNKRHRSVTAPDYSIEVGRSY